MLVLFERFGPYAYTFLLGYSVLNFCWACRREQLSVSEVTRRVCVAVIGLYAAVVPAVFLFTVFASLGR